MLQSTVLICLCAEEGVSCVAVLICLCAEEGVLCCSFDLFVR